MFVRLVGLIRDKDSNERIVQICNDTPIIAEVTDTDYSRGWDERIKTCVTGNYWVRNDCYDRQLLDIGNWVKLNNGNKVVVTSASATQFGYLNPNGSETKVNYLDKNGKLNFVPCTTPKNWGETLQFEDFAHTYEEFSGQMHDYYKGNCSERYIHKNFVNYATKKLGLINMLRKHPKWNETEKAVIVKRKVNMNENIPAATSILAEYRRTHTMTAKGGYYRGDVQDALYYLSTPNYYYVPAHDKPATLNEYAIGRINRFLHKDFSVGVKATKIARLIMTQCCDYGDNDDFEKMYAKYADALSKTKKEIKFVVSANICDYVTMSHGNSWTSCHNFKNRGAWHAGCLSYANDYVTLVAYGVDVDAPDKDIYNQPKIFRNLFMVNEDQTEYIQSRIYPASNLFTYVSSNELFNEVLADCGVEIDKTPLDIEGRGKYTKGRNSLQYHDYDIYGYRYGGNDTSIDIGGAVYHLATGGLLLYSTTMSDKYVGEYDNSKKYLIYTKASRRKLPEMLAAA